MDSAPTCILVLAVSMLTTCSHEFTQKYQYSPNNLITEFMNPWNWMFLFINCTVWVVFIISFANFCGSLEELKWGPMWLISPPLWHACCRQTNYLQNMHGLNCAPASDLWTCHCLQAQEVSHAWFRSHLNMNPLIRMSVNTEKRIMEKITEIFASLTFLSLTVEQR